MSNTITKLMAAALVAVVVPSFASAAAAAPAGGALAIKNAATSNIETVQWRGRGWGWGGRGWGWGFGGGLAAGAIIGGALAAPYYYGGGYYGGPYYYGGGPYYRSRYAPRVNPLDNYRYRGGYQTANGFQGVNGFQGGNGDYRDRRYAFRSDNTVYTPPGRRVAGAEFNSPLRRTIDTRNSVADNAVDRSSTGARRATTAEPASNGEARRASGNEARGNNGTEARRANGNDARGNNGTEARRASGNESRGNTGTEALGAQIWAAKANLVGGAKLKLIPKAYRLTKVGKGLDLLIR